MNSMTVLIFSNPTRVNDGLIVQSIEYWNDNLRNIGLSPGMAVHFPHCDLWWLSGGPRLVLQHQYVYVSLVKSGSEQIQKVHIDSADEFPIQF